MPIIAIGAAIFADVAAAGAVAAGTLGTFEAIGAVGATISAIGAVTGNKALSTAGLVLGGIGGVGSLASAAGVIGDPSVASVFGSDATSTASDTASAAVEAANPDAAALSDTGNIDLGNGAAGDFINNISTATGTEGNAVDTAAAATTPPPVTGSNVAAPTPADQITGNTGTESGSTVGNNLDYANPGGDPTQPVTPTTPVNTQIASGANNTTGTPVGQAPGGTVQAPSVTPTLDPSISAPSAPSYAAPVVPSDTSSTGGLLDFFKTTGGGLLGMGAIQAAGSFIAGATNPLTPAQVNQLNAQAAQNQAAANLQTMQNTNLKQPIPTATRTGANQVTAPLGLINNPNNINTNTTGVA